MGPQRRRKFIRLEEQMFGKQKFGKQMFAMPGEEVFLT